VCVARRALGDRTVPTDAMNLASAACSRKARGGYHWTVRVPMAQMALSIIWASWPLLTAPIWVASTLPFLNTIRVGMPRTP